MVMPLSVDAADLLAVRHLVTTRLSQAATLHEAIPAVLQLLCDRTRWEIGAFWAVDVQDDVMRCRWTWHSATAPVAFIALSRQVTIVKRVDMPGRVWASAEASWISDIVADPNFPRAVAAARDGLHAAVCVPVRGAHVLGAIELYSRDARPSDPSLLQALNAIGKEIAQFVLRKEAEQAVQYYARHDALTGLPNRTLYVERLQAAIGASPRAGQGVAALVMDLERFKDINDTFGHEFGDRLLGEVSARLQQAMRGTDTVARLGGDEFAFILPVSDRAGALRAAEQLCSALHAPVIVDGQPFYVGSSVGVALWPEHGLDAQTLLRRAAVATSQARRTPTSCALYAVERDEHSPTRLALIDALRHTIEAREVMVHYQPKVDVQSGQVRGVEALARWKHPQYGYIPPDHFISLAEHAGLIAPLTLVVMEKAIAQCRAWQRAGITLNVAVNLSMWNLHDPSLPDVVARLLRDHDVAPSRLTLELTESTIMADVKHSMDVLVRLNALGIGLAIDDFGTGYSSLTYLKQLPVGEVKIDKSFVLHMTADKTDATIVSSTIELSHGLGLKVVAEGVEEQDTWDLLAGLGCDTVQGYYLSHALPAAQLEAWMRVPSRRAARRICS